MRRVIAIEKPDGTLATFESGKLITFNRVADASQWLEAGEKLKPIDVPEDHADALISAPRF